MIVSASFGHLEDRFIMFQIPETLYPFDIRVRRAVLFILNSKPACLVSVPSSLPDFGEDLTPRVIRGQKFGMFDTPMS